MEGKLTREEAIKELRKASDSEVRDGDITHHYDEVMKRVEALNMGAEALEQIPKLQNRCYIMSRGMLCGFCKMECEAKERIICTK